jgi:hypothetical protein
MILNWQYKLQVEMNRRQHSDRTESDHSINRMSLGQLGAEVHAK